MKAVIFQSEKHRDEKLKSEMESLLKKYDFTIDEKEPDVVISLGGDGTFLRAVHHYLPLLDKITFIGIKNGTLGFFYNFEISEMETVIQQFSSDQLFIKQYPLIEGKVYNQNGQIQSVYAFNEIRIENPFHALISDVTIDQNLLETFRGNGLSICSSMGSTAYNKSLGGAIIADNLPLLELSEIAPLSNNAYRSLGSSLIVGKDSVITLSGDFSSIIIGYDYSLLENHHASKIAVSLSDKKVRVAYRSNYSVIHSIRKSFIQ